MCTLVKMLRLNCLMFYMKVAIEGDREAESQKKKDMEEKDARV